MAFLSNQVILSRQSARLRLRIEAMKHVWIQTRDGSPTLWDNELGECYRSVKGAFTESWNVFVEPARRFMRSTLQPQGLALVVGEFGLGPGTNWLLWSLGRWMDGAEKQVQNAQAPYYVIERDLTSFEKGLERWISETDQLNLFFKPIFERDGMPHREITPQVISELPRPIVFESLDAMIASVPQSSFRIWFHDPFGYEVNPDGYSVDTLTRLKALWATPLIGVSYACNRKFQDTLQSIGLRVQIETSQHPSLKRQRTEFYL